MKIYVGNLAPDVTEKALLTLFSRHGDAFVRVMKDQTTGRSRAFAYVEMEDDSEAQAALKDLDGKEVNGSAIVVSEAPRDLGTVQFTRPMPAAAKTEKAVLLVRGGPNDGATVALAEGMATMGRLVINDIMVDEPGVSREHAGVGGDSEGYWIKDLGSRNGTFVNGERVGAEPRRLRNMDRIELAGIKTRVHWVFVGS